MEKDSLLNKTVTASLPLIASSFYKMIEGIAKSYVNQMQVAEVLDDSSAKYSKWVIENYGSISLFGGVNRVVSVDQVHVKLHLTAKIEREKFKDREQLEKEILENVEDDRAGTSLLEIINKREVNAETNKFGFSRNDIAILGIAGSGKTTTLKYLALAAARGEKIRGIQRFPFLITLRDLDESKSLRQALSDTLVYFFPNNANDLVDIMIDRGFALIILDGIDELDEASQLRVNREIKELQRRKSKNINACSIICLSGRPYTLDISLDGFVKYDILPLKEDEQANFIDKWFYGLPGLKNKELKLHFSLNKDLCDLGSSPLLLSIICALYFNEFTIPGARSELFQKCIEGLLGTWDAFRSINRDSCLSTLSLQNRIKLSSALAAATLLYSRKIVFKDNDSSILKVYGYATNVLNVEVSDGKELLKSFYNDFSVVIERSPQMYTFIHFQFHEYLCARYLVEAREELEFIRNVKDDLLKWEYPITFIAKSLFKPNVFMCNLWGYIDKSNYDQVNMFTNIIREYPSISLKDIYDIVKGDLSIIESVLSKAGTWSERKSGYMEMSKTGSMVSVNSDQIEITESILPEILKIKSLILLYNEIASQNYEIVYELCLPKNLQRFFLTKGGRNSIYDLWRM